MSDELTNAAITPLLMLSVQTRLAGSVRGALPGGRTVFDVRGGQFEGPNLRGRVLASGGDWVSRSAAGSQLDVRLLLETDDGVTLLLRYQGRASQRDGHAHIEVAGQLDAPDGAYGWLNQLQVFGLGTPTDDGVRYQFYRFTRDS